MPHKGQYIHPLQQMDLLLALLEIILRLKTEVNDIVISMQGFPIYLELVAI